jgi:hypothetical protein
MSKNNDSYEIKNEKCTLRITEKGILELITKIPLGQYMEKQTKSGATDFTYISIKDAVAHQRTWYFENTVTGIQCFASKFLIKETDIAIVVRYIVKITSTLEICDVTFSDRESFYKPFIDNDYVELIQ